jgi:hypothetical protein
VRVSNYCYRMGWLELTFGGGKPIRFLNAGQADPNEVRQVEWRPGYQPTIPTDAVGLSEQSDRVIVLHLGGLEASRFSGTESGWVSRQVYVRQL